MKQPKQFPLLLLLLVVAALATVSGFAAQLCRIGHGPIVPVAILTPYAALLLVGGFEVLPVCIAILQFPIYAVGLALSRARGSLGPASVAVLVVHCIAVAVAFTRVF